MQQITATGGCAHPVHLSGSTTTRDTRTGEVLHHYDTAGEPFERLSVRCRNRRATVCAPCSRLHAGDIYHLVRAGLTGGKDIPTDVRDHPRLFVTLTAPGFGAVHHTADGKRCNPRHRNGECEHGRPTGCGMIHTDADPRIGQPLCPDCYDYTGHVLWHAHAGRLWKAFTDNLYHHLAARTGISRTALRRSVRISYAKVAEYQKRAAVHVHAVMRLDGANGAEQPPPPWADAAVLADAVRTAAAAVRLTVPYHPALGEYELSWGAQLDARPVLATGGPDALTDDAVAAYVAKYVTKGAADTGAGLDHAIKGPADITTAAVSTHIRTLMATCWRLGGLPGLEPLRLRAWAHTLGYRGHVLTKSHRYSTTYTALREERATHQRDSFPGGTHAITESHWRYVGSGHTLGAALIAAGVAEDIVRNREIARTDGTLGAAHGWLRQLRLAPDGSLVRPHLSILGRVLGRVFWPHQAEGCGWMGLRGLEPVRAARISALVAECGPLLGADAGMEAVQELLSDRGVSVIDSIVVTRELLGAGPTALGEAKGIVLSSPSRRVERQHHREFVNVLLEAVDQVAEDG